MNCGFSYSALFSTLSILYITGISYAQRTQKVPISMVAHGVPVTVNGREFQLFTLPDGKKVLMLVGEDGTEQTVQTVSKPPLRETSNKIQRYAKLSEQKRRVLLKIRRQLTNILKRKINPQRYRLITAKDGIPRLIRNRKKGGGLTVENVRKLIKTISGYLTGGVPIQNLNTATTKSIKTNSKEITGGKTNTTSKLKIVTAQPVTKAPTTTTSRVSAVKLEITSSSPVTVAAQESVFQKLHKQEENVLNAFSKEGNASLSKQSVLQKLKEEERQLLSELRALQQSTTTPSATVIKTVDDSHVIPSRQTVQLHVNVSANEPQQDTLSKLRDEEMLLLRKLNALKKPTLSGHSSKQRTIGLDSSSHVAHAEKFKEEEKMIMFQLQQLRLKDRAKTPFRTGAEQFKPFKEINSTQVSQSEDRQLDRIILSLNSILIPAEKEKIVQMLHALEAGTGNGVKVRNDDIDVILLKLHPAMAPEDYNHLLQMLGRNGYRVPTTEPPKTPLESIYYQSLEAAKMNLPKDISDLLDGVKHLLSKTDENDISNLIIETNGNISPTKAEISSTLAEAASAAARKASGQQGYQTQLVLKIKDLFNSRQLAKIVSSQTTVTSSASPNDKNTLLEQIKSLLTSKSQNDVMKKNNLLSSIEALVQRNPVQTTQHVDGNQAANILRNMQHMLTPAQQVDLQSLLGGGSSNLQHVVNQPPMAMMNPGNHMFHGQINPMASAAMYVNPMSRMNPMNSVMMQNMMFGDSVDPPDPPDPTDPPLPPGAKPKVEAEDLPPTTTTQAPSTTKPPSTTKSVITKTAESGNLGSLSRSIFDALQSAKLPGNVKVELHLPNGKVDSKSTIAPNTQAPVMFQQANVLTSRPRSAHQYVRNQIVNDQKSVVHIMDSGALPVTLPMHPNVQQRGQPSILKPSVNQRSQSELLLPSSVTIPRSPHVPFAPMHKGMKLDNNAIPKGNQDSSNKLIFNSISPTSAPVHMSHQIHSPRFENQVSYKSPKSIFSHEHVKSAAIENQPWVHRAPVLNSVILNNQQSHVIVPDQFNPLLKKKDFLKPPMVAFKPLAVPSVVLDRAQPTVPSFRNVLDTQISANNDVRSQRVAVQDINRMQTEPPPYNPRKVFLPTKIPLKLQPHFSREQNGQHSYLRNERAERTPKMLQDSPPVLTPNSNSREASPVHQLSLRNMEVHIENAEHSITYPHQNNKAHNEQAGHNQYQTDTSMPQIQHSDFITQQDIHAPSLQNSNSIMTDHSRNNGPNGEQITGQEHPSRRRRMPPHPREYREPPSPQSAEDLAHLHRIQYEIPTETMAIKDKQKGQPQGVEFLSESNNLQMPSPESTNIGGGVPVVDLLKSFHKDTVGLTPSTQSLQETKTPGVKKINMPSKITWIAPSLKMDLTVGQENHNQVGATSGSTGPLTKPGGDSLVVPVVAATSQYYQLDHRREHIPKQKENPEMNNSIFNLPNPQSPIQGNALFPKQPASSLNVFGIFPVSNESPTWLNNNENPNLPKPPSMEKIYPPLINQQSPSNHGHHHGGLQRTNSPKFQTTTRTPEKSHTFWDNLLQKISIETPKFGSGDGRPPVIHIHLPPQEKSTKPTVKPQSTTTQKPVEFEPIEAEDTTTLKTTTTSAVPKTTPAPSYKLRIHADENGVNKISIIQEANTDHQNTSPQNAGLATSTHKIAEKCSPKSPLFYCEGIDMFKNVTSISAWCVGKCIQGACVTTVCNCSCKEVKSQDDSIRGDIVSLFNGKGDMFSGDVVNIFKQLYNSLQGSKDANKPVILSTGNSNTQSLPSVNHPQRDQQNNGQMDMRVMLSSIERMIDAKLHQSGITGKGVEEVEPDDAPKNNSGDNNNNNNAQIYNNQNNGNNNNWNNGAGGNNGNSNDNNNNNNNWNNGPQANSNNWNNGNQNNGNWNNGPNGNNNNWNNGGNNNNWNNGPPGNNNGWNGGSGNSGGWSQNNNNNNNNNNGWMNGPQNNWGGPPWQGNNGWNGQNTGMNTQQWNPWGGSQQGRGGWGSWPGGGPPSMWGGSGGQWGGGPMGQPGGMWSMGFGRQGMGSKGGEAAD